MSETGDERAARPDAATTGRRSAEPATTARRASGGAGDDRPGGPSGTARVGLRVRGGPVPREPGAPAPRPGAGPERARPDGRRPAPEQAPRNGGISGRTRSPRPGASNGSRPGGQHAPGQARTGGTPRNGTRRGDVPANDTRTDGPARYGTTANGAPRNGTSRNGTTANGAPRNGTSRNGTTANGIPRNGTSRNGTSANGTASARTTPAGIPARDHTPPGRPVPDVPPPGARPAARPPAPPPNGAAPAAPPANGTRPGGTSPGAAAPGRRTPDRAAGADRARNGAAPETGSRYSAGSAPRSGRNPLPPTDPGTGASTNGLPTRPPGRARHDGPDAEPASGRHGVPDRPAERRRADGAHAAGPRHGDAPTTAAPVPPGDDTTGLLTHPEPPTRATPVHDARSAGEPDGPTRAVGPPDPATRAVPVVDRPTGLLPHVDTPDPDDPDADGPDAADAEPGRTRVTGGRRHRAGRSAVRAGVGAAEGPLGKARALLGPGLQTVRTKLGILDAEAKAALTPEQRRTRRRTQVRYGLLGSAASIVLLPLLLFGLGWLFFSVPTPDDAVNNQIATVSYADGGQLARLVPEQGNRIKVPLEEIPPHVREAVLAAEDRSFYSNPGFDITGILRAAWNQIRGGDGGGSTITQQYVKNTLVGNEQSYFRKYKELIVSLKVSQQKTKDEILNDYLNAIYFGRGAYGIQSASLAYFGKPANQLSPSEGALLAGVIQSPSRWDPANDPQKARERWSFVMDGMAQQGWISRADRAAAQFPATIAPQNSSGSSSLTDDRGHILNAVKSELSNLGISDQAFSQGGLQVTTTVDPNRQKELVDAVQSEMAGQPDVLRTGAVAIDPRTGGIVGYYGGKDGTGIDYAKVLKQPGSTFKPFVVLAALMQDPPIGLGQKFDGSEQPGLRNAEGANCPRCDLKQALTISNNVVFTKLASEVGPQKVADAARLAGITQPLDNPDARLALGNKETTPVQLASAYATIAAGGVWHAPHLVSKVVDSDGRVLYEHQPGEGEQRFPEQVARNVTEGMLDVVDHDDLSLPQGQEAAGKTGTVQSRFEGQNNDAWFAGFTPDLVSTVWVGTDRNDPIRNADGEPISGAMLPGKMWQAFMSDAVRNSDRTSEFSTFKPIGKPPADEPPNAPTASATAPATTSAPPAREQDRPAGPAEPAAPPPPAPPSSTGVPAPTGEPGPGDDAADRAGRSSTEPTVG